MRKSNRKSQRRRSSCHNRVGGTNLLHRARAANFTALQVHKPQGGR
jgi:hypothetical protein